jgi:hypothetical protein
VDGVLYRVARRVPATDRLPSAITSAVGDGTRAKRSIFQLSQDSSISPAYVSHVLGELADAGSITFLFVAGDPRTVIVAPLPTESARALSA